jgi:BMFP domain-containing protein YqiC
MPPLFRSETKARSRTRIKIRLARDAAGGTLKRCTFKRQLQDELPDKNWPAEIPRAKSAVSLEWVMAQNRVYEDFTRLVTDAAEMVKGVRREAETAIRSQLERLLATMDVVTREEFEVVKEIAAKARDENEKLSQRVATLEAAIAAASKDCYG